MIGQGEKTAVASPEGGLVAARMAVVEARMAWIRERTGVPARTGGRVRYWGRIGRRPIDGTIEGCSGGFLRVRFDDATQATAVPATWWMQYLDAQGEVVWSDPRMEAQG